MAKFLSRLVMENASDQDDGRWVLVQPLLYQSDIGNLQVIVPAGFQTDLASVPRLPLAYLLTGGRANEAAVIHDFLYTTHQVDRRTADAVLREASTVTGVPTVVRWLMWAGVRAFGWSHWK